MHIRTNIWMVWNNNDNRSCRLKPFGNKVYLPSLFEFEKKRFSGNKHYGTKKIDELCSLLGVFPYSFVTGYLTTFRFHSVTLLVVCCNWAPFIIFCIFIEFSIRGLVFTTSAFDVVQQLKHLITFWSKLWFNLLI